MQGAIEVATVSTAGTTGVSVCLAVDSANKGDWEGAAYHSTNAVIGAVAAVDMVNNGNIMDYKSSKVSDTYGNNGGLNDAAGEIAPRSLSERIADFQKNPQNWEHTAASAEQATGKAAKGGVSIESSYTNNVTGETIHVHDVYKPSGNQIPNHPTYRDYGKQ